MKYVVPVVVGDKNCQNLCLSSIAYVRSDIQSLAATLTLVFFGHHRFLDCAIFRSSPLAVACVAELRVSK